MEVVILVNFIIFALIGSIVVFNGLDLKKWSSWLLGVYGFFSGFLGGFLRSDVEKLMCIKLGALFAFSVMFGGGITHWHKQRLKK